MQRRVRFVKKKKKKQLDSNIHLVPVLEFEEQPPLIPIL